MAETAALDALIHGKRQLVSYRHLSTLLSIPSHQAQSILQSYLASQPENSLRAIWCVTTQQNSVHRTSLCEKPPKDADAHIWALAPATPNAQLSHQTSLAILFQDRLQEIDQATADFNNTNTLRDGRFNRIQSTTAQWTPSSLQPQSPAVANPPPAPSTRLLAAAKPKPRTQDSRPSVKRKSTGKIGVKPKPDAAAAAAAAKPNSLFSTRSLSASATERLKGTQPAPVKKARRVVDDDSDDDQHERDLRALQKEAEENEAAEAERRAEKEELMREVEQLTRKHEEQEPESPEMKELQHTRTDRDHDEQLAQKTDSAKRKFIETFGGLQGARRKLKKITVTSKDEKGYVVTKTIEKWVDADGNELPDQVKPQETMTPPTKKVPFQSSANGAEGASKSSQKARSATGKGASSKKKSVGSAKNKVKGNIMSYFGKKN